MIGTLLISFGVGYTYDLFGRRPVIALSFLGIVVALGSQPWMPSVLALTVNRTLS